MNQGNFIRILYSNSDFILNGMFIYFSLSNVSFERSFNKSKCIFSMDDKNIEVLKRLEQLELYILDKMCDNTKFCQRKCFFTDILLNKNIKLCDDFGAALGHNNNIPFCTLGLKISGVWITDSEYGLTCKFCYLDPGIN